MKLGEFMDDGERCSRCGAAVTTHWIVICSDFACADQPWESSSEAMKQAARHRDAHVMFLGADPETVAVMHRDV